MTIQGTDRVSPTGKFIVASVFLTTLLSTNITWGGMQFPYKGYVIFGLQIGLLSIAIFLHFWTSGHLNRSVLMHPVFLLWSALFLLSLCTSMAKAQTWDIVKQVGLTIVPRLLLVFAVLLDRSRVSTFILMSKVLVLLIAAAVVLGGIVLSFGTESFVLDEVHNRMREVKTVGVGPLGVEVSVFRYNNFIRYTAPIGSQNPNTSGALLFTSILLSIGLVLSRQWTLFLGGSLVMIQALGLAATLSRTSWLSFVVALTVLIVLTTHRLSQVLSRFYVLFASAIVLLLIVLSNDSIFGPIVERATATGLAGREDFWAIALKEFTSNPISGIGLGMSSDLLSGLSGSSGGFHNAYMQLAVELGLPGLMIFVGMLGVPLMMGIHAVRQHRKVLRLVDPNVDRRTATLTKRSAVLVVSYALVVAVTIHSMAESAVFYNGTIGFLWTYVLTAIPVLLPSDGRVDKSRGQLNRLVRSG